MKVPLINAYMNPYVIRQDDPTSRTAQTEMETVAKTARQRSVAEDSGKLEASLDNHDRLISKNERDFFIKLFPENSAQLEKHVLFNRNGKIAAADISKGQIVDGRI